MRLVTRRTPSLLVAAALVLGVVLSTTAGPAAAVADFAPKLRFPMTLHSPAGAIRLRHAAQRIVSLSPTATEMLYAIGAGKQVIAVDDDSDWPKGQLPKRRFNAFSPNVEQLVALRPDLVVVSYNPDNLEAHLRAAGIAVLEQDAPPNLRGTLLQLTWLGDATGHYGRSLRLAASIRRDVQKDAAEVPAHHRSVRVYFELDPQLYSLTSHTYAGQLLKLLGVINIADPAGNSLNGGYPKLSSEYLVKADPQLIFLADTICCHQSLKTLERRPGFAGISAVRHHWVIGLNDDVASRWGPRVNVLMDELTAVVLRYYAS